MRITSLKLLLATGLLLSAGMTSLQAAPATFLKAKVSGTVQTQTINGPADGRIKTTALNNARIFEEFQVSETDYELVLSVESTGLYLRPRHSASVLPLITVARFDDSTKTIVDTKKHVIAFDGALKVGTATNLFQNLGGEVTGTFHYTGDFPVITVKSTLLNASGHGTDVSNSGNDAAILKFKISTAGISTQIPPPQM